MSLLHATAKGASGEGKKKPRQNLCYLNCAAPPVRANLKAFPEDKKKGLNRVALKQRMSIYYVIYLSVTGFTINSFLFLKKKTILYMEKNSNYREQ